jgi:hypothetical protein
MGVVYLAERDLGAWLLSNFFAMPGFLGAP